MIGLFTGSTSFHPDSFKPAYLKTISVHTASFCNPMIGCDSFISSPTDRWEIAEIFGGLNK